MQNRQNTQKQVPTQAPIQSQAQVQSQAPMQAQELTQLQASTQSQAPVQADFTYLYGSAASQYARLAQAEQAGQASQPAPHPPQLLCKDLTLGYEGHPICADLNFEINRGDYLCIVGENGSGKSTLVKTLLGLTPPLAGQILFGDGLSARQIGYLPQQTALQKDFPASCEEIVRSGFLASNGWRPFCSKAQKQRAKDLLEELGIPHLAKRCYRDLSGGQQQRVLLARALCAAQKMLLLDEPVSGLDPAAMQEMYRIIADLNRERRMTILMVSHDLEASVKYATHILHMGSQLRFFGTKEEYVKTPLRMSFRDRGELSRFVDDAVCSRAERGGAGSRRYYR